MGASKSPSGKATRFITPEFTNCKGGYYEKGVTQFQEFLEVSYY